MSCSLREVSKSKIAFVGLLVIAGFVIFANIPEFRRYILIRSM